ncbi:UNVERIFIED_CONTAM: hypothetical protein K2H54_059755 [Gekko kuhli]
MKRFTVVHFLRVLPPHCNPLRPDLKVLLAGENLTPDATLHTCSISFKLGSQLLHREAPLADYSVAVPEQTASLHTSKGELNFKTLPYILLKKIPTSRKLTQ